MLVSAWAATRILLIQPRSYRSILIARHRGILQERPRPSASEAAPFGRTFSQGPLCQWTILGRSQGHLCLQTILLGVEPAAPMLSRASKGASAEHPSQCKLLMGSLLTLCSCCRYAAGANPGHEEASSSTSTAAKGRGSLSRIYSCRLCSRFGVFLLQSCLARKTSTSTVAVPGYELPPWRQECLGSLHLHGHFSNSFSACQGGRIPKAPEKAGGILDGFTTQYALQEGCII